MDVLRDGNANRPQSGSNQFQTADFRYYSQGFILGTDERPGCSYRQRQELPTLTGKTSGESVFEYYNRGYNVGVGGVVVKEGRLLLVRRASAYGRGNWQIPGGFIERTETMEGAVVREVEEEAGVTASPRGILAIRNRLFDGSNSTYVVFQMDWVSGEPRADGIETDRAEWYSVDEVRSLKSRPAINLALAEAALGDSPCLLTGKQVSSIDGETYTLFVG